MSKPNQEEAVSPEPVATPEPASESATESAVVSRAQARARIFASKKLRSERFDFFGIEVELRQPTFGAVMDVQANKDREAGIIQTLVDQAYVPGTNEKLFEPADVDQFLEMPFGADFIRVTEALEKLTEVNFRDKKPS